MDDRLREEVFEESFVPEARVLLLREVSAIVRARLGTPRRDLVEETRAPRCDATEEDLVWVDQSRESRADRHPIIDNAGADSIPPSIGNGANRPEPVLSVDAVGDPRGSIGSNAETRVEAERRQDCVLQDPNCGGVTWDVIPVRREVGTIDVLLSVSCAWATDGDPNAAAGRVVCLAPAPVRRISILLGARSVPDWHTDALSLGIAGSRGAPVSGVPVLLCSRRVRHADRDAFGWATALGLTAEMGGPSVLLSS